MQHGLMSLAVLDPRFTHTMISVTVWVEGTAEEVRGRLLEGASMKVTQASSAAQIALVDISVVAVSLKKKARKVLQGMRITSQQAAQLVRTGFSGLRGVAGSWELLLAIGGLYLQHDSLSRNQKKVEAEIGPKAHEAKLALQGSSLGVLGGQVELIGLILRSSVSHVNIPWTRGVAATGEVFIKLGAFVSSVAGVYDMAQAVAASQRAKAVGDSVAKTQHRLAAALYGAGSAAFALAVFKSSLFGPLGLAVILTLAAYALNKHAEKNESSPLECWARRCCFGKADEVPMVHWKTPEYADIAFAELNAATLGVKAMLHFESSLITDSAAPRIGGLVGLEREHKLKFKIVLPSYRDEVSAYRWHLIVHRCGDGEFPEFTGGELILTDEYHASSVDPITKSVSFSGFAAPRWPDYKTGLGFDKRKHVASVGEGEAVSLEISGVVELMPTIGSHSIVAATLLLMYWPDRNIDSAYVEVCGRGQND
jgi:hypothetical protein